MASTPKKVLYGYSRLHDCLCFFDEDWARGTVDEITAIGRVRTLGELRALQPTIKYLWIPDDLRDYEGEDDDEPWSVSECGPVQDGDWPPMPTRETLRFSDRKALNAVRRATGAQEVDTVLNGEYLDIPVSAEPQLVETLTAAGYSVVRDDDVVAALVGNDDVS